MLSTVVGAQLRRIVLKDRIVGEAAFTEGGFLLEATRSGQQLMLQHERTFAAEETKFAFALMRLEVPDRGMGVRWTVGAFPDQLGT